MIWGYAPVGIACNWAQDVDGRFAVLIIWGPRVSGGSYAELVSLTNIPATVFGAAVYEVMFADSSRVLTTASVAVIATHKAHGERRQERGGLLVSRLFGRPRG